MTNEIKNKIEKMSTEFGGFENIALLREAYHACNPNRPFGWKCDAVRINGNTVEFGVVTWDFEEDTDDASNYNWDFGQNDFGDFDTYCIDNELDEKLVNQNLDSWKH